MERPDCADLVYEFESIDQATIAGAFIDLYDMKAAILKLPEETQVETYLRRCRLMNAHFFETMCGIAAKLAGASEEVTEQARSFGRNYGIALQIVNDLADFVPPEDGPGTREKSSNDAWADLRNYRVTLPIILGRSRGSVACRELIDHLLYCACGVSEPYRELTSLLVHEGHIAAAQGMAKGYAKKAHESLQVFPKEKRAHLSAMLVIFGSNRYYRALAKYHDGCSMK